MIFKMNYNNHLFNFTKSYNITFDFLVIYSKQHYHRSFKHNSFNITVHRYRRRTSVPTAVGPQCCRTSVPPLDLGTTFAGANRHHSHRYHLRRS
ncbi:hypothetical protein Hanom_Chr02g00099951 [Helianthus anomalus]